MVSSHRNLIKDEVTKQINEGLKEFFTNLDKKMEQRPDPHTIRMKEVFDNSIGVSSRKNFAA